MSVLRSLVAGAILANDSFIALARPRNRFDVNGQPRQLVLNDDNKFKIM